MLTEAIVRHKHRRQPRAHTSADLVRGKLGKRTPGGVKDEKRFICARDCQSANLVRSALFSKNTYHRSAQTCSHQIARPSAGYWSLELVSNRQSTMQLDSNYASTTHLSSFDPVS